MDRGTVSPSCLASGLHCTAFRSVLQFGGQHLVFIPRQKHPVLAAKKKSLVIFGVSEMIQY